MTAKGINLIDNFPLLNKVILKSRIIWSIHLRWVAVAVFFITIILSKYTFKLDLLYSPILKTLVALAFINLVYYIIFKWIKEFSFLAEVIFLTIHIIIDLLILTALLNLTGGIENPLYLFYLVHVIFASIILPRKFPYLIATFVILLFSSMIFLEYTGIVKHHSIFNVGATKNEIYNFLVLIVFTITTFVCTYIASTFMKFFRTSKTEIDNLNRQLIKADQEKAVFFRYASHELKSPIVAIKSAMDGVLNISKDQENKKLHNVLERASARASQMLEIINELLELSHNREFRPHSCNEKFDIHAKLKEVILNEMDHANSKGIVITHDIDQKEANIKGRVTDFEKVFSNLIGNAIHYNKENGEIKVTGRIENNYVVIKICDSGIGIPKGDLSKIFSEFYRAENAKKQVSFGTGLGLSLVKQIVENYKGTVTAESEIGKGSIFTIRLPLRSK